MNDKLLHRIAGLLIALFFGWLFDDVVLGFLFSFIAAVGKEMWDYSGHGTVEKADMLATVQGGAIGSLLLMVLKWLG